VNHIENIESESTDGIGAVKVFLQPKGSLDEGLARVAAIG
jgi:hypothetical protein